MNETKLFYSPLWQEDAISALPDWPQQRDIMLAKIYALERESSGVTRTNFGGWQSEDDIYIHPEMGWVVEHIMRLSNQLAPEYSSDLAFNNGQIWANINRKHHFNAPHTHANSLLSGVFYLKVNSEDQGVIQFFDAREGTPSMHWNCFVPLKGRTLLTDDTHTVKPVEGRMLFFPSWLKHWVTPNLTDDERVSLSFNIRAI